MIKWKSKFKIAMTGLLGVSIICSLAIQGSEVYAKPKKTDVLVDSTVEPKSEVELQHTKSTITINGTTIDLAEKTRLVDKNADGKKLASINVLLNVNIPEMENDTVDNFENYFGLDTLLNDSWAINKDSGCELSLSNTNEKVGNGSYALRFEYKETKNGWAGAVCSRTVDYSSYNALQMWIVPDGKNQKTVIQINTADGGSYEAYLNTYEDYVDIKR